jgi:hypothetical protein
MPDSTMSATEDSDDLLDAATALLLWIDTHNARIDDNRRKQHKQPKEGAR